MMDEKIWFVKQREIDNLTSQLKNAEIHIEKLETDLKYAQSELVKQKSLIPWLGELAQAGVKIKELEGTTQTQDEMLDIASTRINEAEEKFKELEEELRISREAHADTMNGQGRRIKELKEGIEKVWQICDRLVSLCRQ